VNRNPDVDQWLDEAAHPLEGTMRRARDIILGADDRVTESIKWKTPTFSFKGNIASFNPSKNLVSIMFHRGAEIPGDHPASRVTASSSAPCGSRASTRWRRAERSSRRRSGPGAR
jgi:hypothetical protein